MRSKNLALLTTYLLTKVHRVFFSLERGCSSRPLTCPQTQMALPARADHLLVCSTPQERVRVLLPDVSFDGTELQGCERAAAHHADHSVPLGVKVHQVLAAPVFVVVAAVIAARNSAQAWTWRSLDPGFASRGPGCWGEKEWMVGSLCDAPVAGGRWSHRCDHTWLRVLSTMAIGKIVFFREQDNTEISHTSK